MAQRIRIFVTGGTFDKEYNELTGELFFKETHVDAMLRLGRSHVDVAVETLMMIDSLQMTETGRRLILDRCLACPERRIVITHGTDTMENTAAALAQGIFTEEGVSGGLPPGGVRGSASCAPQSALSHSHVSQSSSPTIGRPATPPLTRGPLIADKTVVLTGAMIPYQFGSSDGMFNLGTALAFVQTLPPGVYVAMNGRYFPWDNVRKNRELGIFEAAE